MASLQPTRAGGGKKGERLHSCVTMTSPSSSTMYLSTIMNHANEVHLRGCEVEGKRRGWTGMCNYMFRV